MSPEKNYVTSFPKLKKKLHSLKTYGASPQQLNYMKQVDNQFRKLIGVPVNFHMMWRILSWKNFLLDACKREILQLFFSMKIKQILLVFFSDYFIFNTELNHNREHIVKSHILRWELGLSNILFENKLLKTLSLYT